jgi:hypothetical protein
LNTNNKRLTFEEGVAPLEKSYFVPPSRVTNIVSMIHQGLGDGKTGRGQTTSGKVQPPKRSRKEETLPNTLISTISTSEVDRMQ